MRSVIPRRLTTTVIAIAMLGGATAASARTDHASSVAAGVAYANAQVKKYLGATGLPDAGPPIKGGIKSLKGKKIWFIPQSTQIPYQVAVEAGVQAAAKAAGLKLEVCNGGGTPSTEAGCVQDALSGGAAGVTEDGITIGQIQQSVNALEARHIPIVEAGLFQRAGNDKIAYAWNNSFGQSALSADALIAASKGKANVLVIRHTDSPATEAFMDDGGLKQIKEHCPDCKVEVINTNATQVSQLPGQVSAEIDKDSGIDYVLAEFDFDVSSVETSLQSLDKKIPIYSTTALLPGVQGIANNTGEVADAGTSAPYAGWAIVDQVLRMMRKQPPNKAVPMPLRLFNKSNVGSLSLTAAAFANGSWFRTGNFQRMFEKLWAGK